jgi:hypothetical protein
MLVAWIRPDKNAQVLHRQQAVLDGCQALGYEIVELDSDIRPGNPILKKLSFAVCSGLRPNTANIQKILNIQRTPTLIVELGFLKRANNNGEKEGYFQLGWGRLCDIPAKAPADRWEALQLPLAETFQGIPEYVLVADQVGFDAQHGLSSKELQRWLVNKSAAHKREIRRPMIWRPHPNQIASRPENWSLRMVQNPRLVSLESALSKAAAVITYNSTLGIDAMLQAIPVYCHVKAHYAEAAKGNYTQRLAYMQRLAYAQ